MKNLESKQMPFRTIDEFYKPFYKEKAAQGIKVFPKSNPENIIMPKGELPSILSYVSGLNAAKQLPRRIYNRQQYFSNPKKCKKLHQKSFLSINNQTLQQNSREQRQTKNHLSTISSIKTPSNSSFCINRLKFYEGKQLESLKNQFSQTIREKSDNRQLKYSFYNTLQKNDYFHKSFYKDSCLTQRKTARFQNSFQRNIHAQEILRILEKSKDKLRTGI